jgi:hypothetical protein
MGTLRALLVLAAGSKPAAPAHWTSLGFDLKYGNPGLPQARVTRTIELSDTEVIPRVRELLGESERSSKVVGASGRRS